MKNEYKIDPIPMHDDRDLVQRSFQNIRGLLERGAAAVNKF